MLESHTNFALAPKDFKINANIRQKGENASLNSVLVPKNTRLNYGHILGVLKDDKDLQLKPLESQDHDVILSSAGVSVGDKDFFKDALKEKTPFFIMKKSISNLENR